MNKLAGCRTQSVKVANTKTHYWITLDQLIYSQSITITCILIQWHGNYTFMIYITVSHSPKL